MPDAHASALAGLAPGRLLGFANALLGGPFATHARASNALGSRMLSFQSYPPRLFNARRARVSGNCNYGRCAEVIVRNAAIAATWPGASRPPCEFSLPPAADASHRCRIVLDKALGMIHHRRRQIMVVSSRCSHPHRADTCCSSVLNTASGLSSRQVSALFGKMRTTPDSTVSDRLTPLHFPLRCQTPGTCADRSAPFQRHGNYRDRQNGSCAKSKDSKGRDAPHVAQVTALGREASPRPRPQQYS